MYSNLLSAGALDRLASTADYTGLIASLKNTGYGDYLEQIKDKDLSTQKVILQLKFRLSDAFNSVIQMSPGNTRTLIVQLYRYYELGNLKAVLRSILTGAGWQEIQNVLFPMGSRTTLPAQAMVESGNVGTAVELLRGTPYYDSLSYAMKRFSAEQSLFPLEVALDLSYWRALWQETLQLSGEDRAQALRVVGSLVDMNNLMWAIRYRVYHHLSEEELINYTLPFGYHVRDEDIRAIAAGSEIAMIVHRLYPEVPDVDELLAIPRQGLPRLELQLKKHILERCQAAFIGNPFQIGIAIAFLLLLDLEIQDLTVLLEAKSTSVPEHEFRPYLLHQIPT